MSQILRKTFLCEVSRSQICTHTIAYYDLSLRNLITCKGRNESLNKSYIGKGSNHVHRIKVVISNDTIVLYLSILLGLTVTGNFMDEGTK